MLNNEYLGLIFGEEECHLVFSSFIYTYKMAAKQMRVWQILFTR